MNKLQFLWDELAGSGGPPCGFLTRLLEAQAGCRIFAALKMPDKLPCIVIGVPRVALSALNIPPDSAAFRCIVSEIDGLGQDHAGIVLTLNDGKFKDLFILLSTDIINSASKEKSPQRAVSAIFRTIEKWRRFIQRLGNGTLSDEEVQGLIGELSVLARLINKYGERSGMIAWTGPEGALHDFVIGGMELEVKSHQGNPAGGIWINDLAQLQPTPASSLYLMVPYITLSAVSGLTLPNFIEHLKRLLTADDSAQELFLTKLASLGYLESFSGRYTRNYAIGDLAAYRVADAFPAIAPSVIPAAVEKVRYKLRLAPLEPWRIDPQTIIGSGSTPWGRP